MRFLDFGLVFMLIIGAVLHTFGTLTGYPTWSELWVWSLGASLASALIGAVNLLRLYRPGDRALALICGVSALLWAAVALAFGAAISNIADPRVVWHAVAAGGLGVLAPRQALS